MRRLLALCLLGLACTTAGCSLDFGNQDQNNDGQDDQPPGDQPGDEYRACVLQTLEDCDAANLTPNACTALIAANCNTSSCDATDPNCCPDGSTDCVPPPDDCYIRVFQECVDSGADPQECAIRADLVCNPQCMPGDLNCCDPASPDCQPCTDPSGQDCPPPPCMDPNDPTCGCDPASGQGCDCWSVVFQECVAAGIPPEECALRADFTCNPQPCTDPTDPACNPCPDPMDPNCNPGCDPASGQGCDCWSTVFQQCIDAGVPPEECSLRADEACSPTPCPDPSNPACGCDPNTDPTCGGDCWSTTFQECIAAGLPPDLCQLRADEVCNPQPCDPMTDPTCGGDCWNTAFQECIAAGATPDECALRADQVCNPTPCPDPSNPACGCDPMTDPTCGGDCWTTTFQECVASGAPPDECALRADQVCTPSPCPDPSNPACGCDPMTDPTCGGGNCWDSVFQECVASGAPPDECALRADQVCTPSGCTDPTDPSCYPPPPTCPDPMDPACGGVPYRTH